MTFACKAAARISPVAVDPRRNSYGLFQGLPNAVVDFLPAKTNLLVLDIPSDTRDEFHVH